LVNPTSSARPVRPDAERVPTLAAPVRNAPDDSSWSPPEPVAIDDPFLDDPQPVMKEPALVVRSEALPVCECGKKNCPGVCLDPGHPEKPHFKKPGDIDRGDCPPYRYRIPDCKRAGNPHCVARWAKCGTDDKYSAWFVGGGSPFRKGRCRRPTEGTWGLDYEGLFGHANVWLRYTWGREQGGEGAYSTDGEPEFVARTHEVLGLGH